MAVTNERNLGTNNTLKPPKTPRGHKDTKGSHKGSGRGHKSTHATVKHAPKPGRWHASTAHPAGADSRAASGSERAGHAASSAAPAYLLQAGPGGAFAHVPGITGVLIDLVGEGTIGLHAALQSWQSEQTRLTNRAWRRPGGLARMGSL